VLLLTERNWAVVLLSETGSLLQLDCPCLTCRSDTWRSDASLLDCACAMAPLLSSSMALLTVFWIPCTAESSPAVAAAWGPLRVTPCPAPAVRPAPGLPPYPGTATGKEGKLTELAC